MDEQDEGSTEGAQSGGYEGVVACTNARGSFPASLFAVA